VELNFRGEFEMARGSEEYNRLVGKLPEVFVGKVERLSNLIKVLCVAGKRCMKEKKMHMGPWRKHRYMQATSVLVPNRRGCSLHHVGLFVLTDVMSLITTTDVWFNVSWVNVGSKTDEKSLSELTTKAVFLLVLEYQSMLSPSFLS